MAEIDLNPPGVQGNLKKFLQGGEMEDWMPYDTVKFYTNAFIVRDNQILLGYKKRGFGMNKYNGFGGKVEPGETSLDAAVRELEEEAGIKAELEHAGVLFFLSEGEDKAFHIDIYRGKQYTGEITESDEMRPEWFSAPKIPFEQMWETDCYWIPLLLQGKPFAGRADFMKAGDKLLPCKWWFGTVQ
ncbi:hypothetical protein WG66_011159 [Moniliophthora roreri]|uniref:Oxidized purine nucleoside triphosphate hydrolase n=1 Tax=Moniliophthora roreri TaxID=221103 RepID=A0A0W0FJB6_MONRR|nr:hypothetical protein WG66_011159 [Moniliophthora roreri]